MFEGDSSLLTEILNPHMELCREKGTWIFCIISIHSPRGMWVSDVFLLPIMQSC